MKLLVAGILVLALAGCTGAPDAAVTPAPTVTSSTILDPDLVPKALPDLGTETVAAEAQRLTAAVEALLGETVILNVDDASQVVPVDDDLPAYYAVYRTYSLDLATDPLALAQTVVAVLQQSGWKLYDATNEGGVYISALSGGPSDTPWFALVGGDLSIEGQSVLTIQIASPDLGG